MAMNEEILRKLKGARARLYRVFMPGKRTLRQVGYRGADFVVLANEDVGWRLITQKTYEADELDCLEGLIRKDDLCLDVGGNVGIFSVFMARKAAEGRVVVFEPIPLNRNIISLNATLNRVDNIEVRAAALSDSSGEVSFSVSVDSANSSLRPTDRKPEAYTISVRATTLDEAFARDGKRVGVIKIDVEGAELPVLRGGRALLSDKGLRPRALLVEVCGRNAACYGYRPEDLVAYMASLGYAAHMIKGGKAVRGWRPSKRSVNVLFVPEGA